MLHSTDVYHSNSAVCLTPNYPHYSVHEQHMLFRITNAEIQSLNVESKDAIASQAEIDSLKSMQRSSVYLALVKEESFVGFIKGIGGIHQLMRDILGGYQFAGKRLLEEPEFLENNDITKNNEIAQQILIRLFGEVNAQKIIAAHSQLPCTNITMTINNAYPLGEDNALSQPRYYRANTFVEDGEIYQEYVTEEFPILSPHEGKEKPVGYLTGTLRAIFKLVGRIENDVEKFGYELQFIDSNNEDIINIFRNNPIPIEELTIKYCQYSAFNEASLALEKVLHDDDQKYHAYLKEAGVKVLHEVKAAFHAKHINEERAVTLINKTTALITHPTLETAVDYQQEARTIQKRDWGYALGGAMLALLGIFCLVACVGIAVVSFGLLTPVSIIASVLSVSMMTGGIAVGAGVVATGAVAVGATLFSAAIKGKTVTTQPPMSEPTFEDADVEDIEEDLGPVESLHEPESTVQDAAMSPRRLSI